ncbi:MAG TPA: hypothetical protein VFX92_13330 [Candidatus Krumholzibacteria bacterium]|nr:hypothetical protein [Candidatus Krumholzibacteria bacterium]
MSLRSLPDESILSRIHELVRRERGMTLRILDHWRKSNDASSPW